jgi:hypothetical protein
MLWFSSIGLVFDLVGVFLLGVDLIRVQLLQKTAASRDKEALEKEFPRFSDLAREQTLLDTRVTGRAAQFGEGMVDAVELDTTLRAFRSEINKTQIGIHGLTKYLFETVNEKTLETKRSLKFSYVGIALIIFGFILQLIGLIGPYMK